VLHSGDKNDERISYIVERERNRNKKRSQPTSLIYTFMKLNTKTKVTDKKVSLPENIRLGWKGLPGTNTVAYYNHSFVIGAKSFNIGLR
jgi:hypothetical protein